MRSISRYWIVLAALVVVLGVAIWMNSRRLAQPTYHGLSLSYWIDRLPGAQNPSRGIMWSRISSEDYGVEPEKALPSIGTNALPYLASELNAPDGSQEKLDAAWKMTKQFWQRLISRGKTVVPSSWNQEKTSGQLRHWKAATAIHALGPAAKPLIPQLTTMLNSPMGDGEACSAAAYALSAMGPDGMKPLMIMLTNTTISRGWNWPQLCVIWALGQTPEAGRQAIPQLLSKLQDKDANVRMAVVWTLGQLHTNEEVIVPALASQLSDSGFNVKSMTEQALKEYGFSGVNRAQLTKRLTNSIPWYRKAATNAYLALYPDEAAQLGLK